MTEMLTPEFRSLFEQSPGVLLALLPNRAFTIVAATDAHLRATTTTREDTYGRPFFEAFPDESADPHATPEGDIRASFERVLATRAPDVMAVRQHRVRRPEAQGGGFEERSWRPVNAPVLGSDGEVRYLLHQREDVTEAVGLAGVHEATEARWQRLNAVFVQAPTAIAVLLGPRYVIAFANPLVCRLWGRTRDQVLGLPLFTALPEAADQGFEGLLDGVLTTGTPFVGRELPVRIARLEGGAIEEVYFNFVYEPLRDATGCVEGVTVFASDGTEAVRKRRAAEAAAATRERLSDERLRQVVEATGTGTWELDLDASHMTADAQFYALTGLPPGSLITTEMAIGAAPPEDRERVASAFAAALAGENGGQYAVEHRTIGLGSAPERWVEARGQAVFDEAGRAVRLAGTVVDIGARKAAEREREALLAREAAARAEAEAARNRLHSLFQNAPAFMCSTRGPRHVFEMANTLFERMVGSTRELLGRPTAEALPEVVAQGYVALLDRVYETGLPYVGREASVQLDRTAAGVPEHSYLTFIYQPRRDARGEVEGIDTFGFDVTEEVLARRRVEALVSELRASEVLLRVVTDALPVLVAFVAPDERYRLVNKAYEDWFGQPQASLVGRTVREFIGEAAYAVMSPYVRRGLAGERFTFEQHGVPYRSGGTRDVRVTFMPHRETSGAMGGYVSLVEDISAQRRLEEGRRQQAEFEQQLIGIVSHDLRNPLNAILLASTLLTRREDLSDRVTKTLVRIQNAAERATRMVSELLDFTQARLGGGIRIQPAPADLHAVTRTVLEEIEAAYPDRELRVRHEGDGTGEWDAGRLAQVVQNLVTNALQYGPADGAVAVTTRGEGAVVSLSVHNAGMPIPAAMLQRIFEPLQRGISEMDRTGRSIGLGLYIVKQLVDAHGGTLVVESTEAAGTTFTVRLPRAEQAAPR